MSVRKVFSIIFRGLRKVKRIIFSFVNHKYCYFIFYIQYVKFDGFHSNGIPYVSVAMSGSCSIGNGFKMNNGLKNNPIGPSGKCIIVVNKNASLNIGENVGISQTAIICHSNIKIGNNVKLGGGVRIYDTDFHSLNASFRLNRDTDFSDTVTSAVEIKNNVFIGAYSTILKGVTIGENSIVGACSVVTKNIPENEVWAGNPAKKIRDI